MYAESGLSFRFMQSCSPEIHQFEDFFNSYKLSDEMNNLVESCEYGFGEESDLFKAPEPIIEEPMLAVDPLSQELAGFSDLVSLQSDQHRIDTAFYDCEQELLVKSVMESPFSEVLDIKDISLVARMDNVMKSGGVVISDVPISKSMSLGNLSSIDTAQHEDAVIQSFPNFPPVDYGMRRAFSESDIETLRARNTGVVHSQLDRIIVSCTSEDRREKLSRYRNKKSRRNFRHKIKEGSCRQSTKDPREVCKNRGDAEMRIS